MLDTFLQSILSKKKGKINCEDYIGFHGNTYWLLDGASVPKNLKVKNEWDASWYIHKLNEGIVEALHEFDESTLLTQILAKAIENVSTHLNPFFDAPNFEYYLPSSTVVMTRLTDQYLDYLVLGDSYFLMCNNSNLRVVTDDRLQQVKSDLRKKIVDILKTGIGYQSEDIKKIKKEILIEEIVRRNNDRGFWIASNQPRVAEKAITGRIVLTNEDWRFLLMSDGLASAVTELNIFDSWQSLLEFVRSKGLEECIKLIRLTEENDLTGQKYPRFSQSDDASAILITR